MTAGACALAFPAFSAENGYRIFVASYEGGGRSAGIHSFAFDFVTGQMSNPELVAKMSYPGNLYVHPSGNYLYAGSGDSALFRGTNFISSYKIEGLKLIEIGKVSSGGFRPSHGDVDNAGKYIVIPNYRSGNVVLFNIENDGAVGKLLSYAGEPPGSRTWTTDNWDKPHIALFSATDRFVIVAEISANRLMVYRVDRDSGKLQYHSEQSAPPSSGPRHVFFHPNNRFLYSANERGSSISSFSWNEETGIVKHLQTIRSIPSGYAGDNEPSHIEVDPGGRFVYMANRGHNSIAMYSIDQMEGTLTLLGFFPLGGRAWCFEIDRSGNWLLVASYSQSTIVSLRIDQETGLLYRSGFEIDIVDPACLRIVG